MAVRVSPQQVKNTCRSVLNDSGITDSMIRQYIETANVLVNRYLGDTTILGADDLAQIELYMAAHILAIADQNHGMVTEQEVGEGRILYGGEFLEGLSSTRFGQMAMTLDATGVLRSAGRSNARFRVM